MTATGLFEVIKEKFVERFSLRLDAASQEEVTVNVHKGINMRGINLWVLIFAIFIASLGLNINSTAVIIGAMLVSPLMGPIIGMGFSFGINDFNLLKSSFRNFLIMVAVSLVTSTLFFLLPLISFDKSELLARTSPTTYDLLIALFGGLAGMVAQTRKERTGTVIAGVAIATALIPPLCTVGYGIATMQIKYMAGALYLFLMNSVFIALASYIVTLLLKYDKVVLLDKAKEKRWRKWMIVLIIVVTTPSVLIAVNIFQRSSFISNANNFINNAFKFENTIVIDQSIQYKNRRTPAIIEVRLVGEALNEDVIANLKNQMQVAPYFLKNTDLVVRQTSKDENVDLSLLQMSYVDIIKEKDRQINVLKGELASIKTIDTLAVSDISRELSVFVPDIRSISLSKHVGFDNSGTPVDTSYFCILNILPNETPDTSMIRRWLGARTKSNRIHLIISN